MTENRHFVTSVSLIPPGQVVSVLPAVVPFLQIAADTTEGRKTADDVLRPVLDGSMNLWVVHTDGDVHGMLVTEVRQYADMRMLVVQHCAMLPGTLASVEDEMQEVAARFARDAGCAGMEFVGRPGWRQTAKKYGYEVRSVTYHKLI